MLTKTAAMLLVALPVALCAAPAIAQDAMGNGQMMSHGQMKSGGKMTHKKKMAKKSSGSMKSGAMTH